jgi:shikimate dehydrogenase
VVWAKKWCRITLQNIKKTVMVDTVRKRFGLLGRNISYSFSKGYFTDKFNSENFAGCTYENFDIPEIDAFAEVIKNTSDLKGLNVTIPYKETIFLLDTLSKKSNSNWRRKYHKITKKGKLKAY